MKELINKSAISITDIWDNHSQYPDISLNDKGQTFIVWQQYNNRQDSIFSGRLEEDQITDVTRISGQGNALRPKTLSIGEVTWFVWSECVDREWSILARFVKDGVYSQIITIDTSEAAFYPSLLAEDDNLLVLWSEQSKGYSKTVLKSLNTDEISDKELVSESDKSYRPSGVIGGDGRLYVAYDIFDGKDYHVVIKVRDKGKWLEEKKINKSKDWATSPIVIKSKEGVTVGWYDIGNRASFSYLSCDIYVNHEGQLISSEPDRFTSGINWYQNVSMDVNNNGVAVFAYTWGKYNVHVRYRKDNGPWSKPVVMSFNDGHCGLHPNVVIDDEDVVHLIWQFANKNGHMHRNASIVYNRLRLEEIDKYADESSELIEDKFVKPISADKKIDKQDISELNNWLDKNGYKNLSLVFGDIHGQSTISDGVGEIDQYYHFARVKADLDFTALTDHDCYPDWISESEWEWIRTSNRLANTGNLACLLAYEWTPNEYKYDFGHKNVYYRGDDGEMFRSEDIGGMTPYNLFQSLKKYDAMAIPHHPAADWGSVSAATDWDFHDPEIQRLVEMFSRHAPFEFYGNKSKYTKNIGQFRRHSVQDALARKYRLGFTAGSDSHQLEHGIEGGIVAAFVPELTRENVYDALYDRFVYATTGSRILVSLKIGQSHMGQETIVDLDKPINVEVSILGTDKVKVELIKNNQVIHTEKSDSKVCDFTFTDKDRSDSDYYYVRVTQDDEHMAWSSPIWVDSK